MSDFTVVKVSVIIPAYNAMTYLPETMESVLRQTFSSFEVLIVDDGSSDGIGQWASQITDPRVKLISQKNQGVSAARNIGITHSQGEYIAFLDADDLWKPTKLEKQVQCLEDNPAVGLVITWEVFVDEQGNPTGEPKTFYPEGDVFKQMIEKCLIHCGSTPMVRRICFDSVGVFDRDLRYGEDWNMWTRIASRYPFAVVKEPLVYYRQHHTNTSKNCQLLGEEINKTIEKTFQSIPHELMYLKGRAYGNVSLYIAWKFLGISDNKSAIYFGQQAVTQYPKLLLSESYIRLILIATMRLWLGFQGYSRLLAVFNTLRKPQNLFKRIPNRQPSLEDN